MKKFIAVFVSACIFTSTLSVSFAGLEETDIMAISINDVENSTDEPSTEDLTRITTSVKSKIEIPEELSEFSYNFFSKNYYTKPYWALSWSNEEYTKRLRVTVDQYEHIMSFYFNENKDENSKPVYLRDELKVKSDEFINEIAPEVSKNIKYKNSDFNGVYSGTYTYNYVRIENDIEMPDNTVSVSVNYETGKVTSININWLYDAAIPSNEALISDTEAKEKIGKEIKMNLVYRNKVTKENGVEKIKAFLVYIPDKSYVAIDAKTGELYLEQEEWISKEDYAAEESMNMKSMDSAGGLTEKEIEKIDELKGLISKEEAIKNITDNKYLLIDNNMISINARLVKNYSYITGKEDKEYVWKIEMNDPRKIDYKSGDTYRAYLYASVDAKTGKIVSFNSSVKGYYDDENAEWSKINVKYSADECQNVFEKFVNTQIPEKIKNTKKAKANNGYLLKYIDKGNPIYGGYNFNYNRTNEGIEYSYNSINGAVDGVTGKVYSFSCNWDDNVNFESPKNVMSAEKAFENYISKEGFGLKYEINSKNIYDDQYEEYYKGGVETENEVRLVYRTDIFPESISPFTGKQLDYDGKEYVEKEKIKYENIDSHWAKRAILLLADMNIGFDKENFNPDSTIKMGEFEKLVNELAYSKDGTDEELKDSTVTRVKAVKRIIEGTNYSKIAELKGIFATMFKDNSKISESDIGYVALAKGLGIVTGDANNNFNPNKELTKAEAAVMLIKLAGVR